MSKDPYAVFPVTIFGKVEPYAQSDTISKARVSIFYKGHNRNGSYISEEFAEKLIQSLPYAPVKGIYSPEDGDYTNHNQRLDAEHEHLIERPYGFIPNPTNFSWEKRLDEDGVEREYACADVLLWTGLYKEASEIVGKPQSMELYRPSIEGDWEFVEGARSFKFQDASFLGLQVLGENTEPAFEGATFFELSNLHSFLTEYAQKLEEFISYQGEKHMDKTKKVTEEVTDETLLEGTEADFEAPAIEEPIEEKPEVEVAEVVEEEVVEPEKKEEEEISFSAEDIAKMQEDLEELRNKNAEFEQKISTLEQENGELKAELLESKDELSELREFKLAIDVADKENILSKYSEVLDSEILNIYKDKLSEFTAEELDKELAHKYISETPELFSSEQKHYPKDKELSGIEAILSKYKNKEA